MPGLVGQRSDQLVCITDRTAAGAGGGGGYRCFPQSSTASGAYIVGAGMAIWQPERKFVAPHVAAVLTPATLPEWQERPQRCVPSPDATVPAPDRRGATPGPRTRPREFGPFPPVEPALVAAERRPAGPVSATANYRRDPLQAFGESDSRSRQPSGSANFPSSLVRMTTTLPMSQWGRPYGWSHIRSNTSNPKMPFLTIINPVGTATTYLLPILSHPQSVQMPSETADSKSKPVHSSPPSPPAPATHPAVGAVSQPCTPRPTWSPELQDKFVAAVTELGGLERLPTAKALLHHMTTSMGCTGISIDQMKYHLRKTYRIKPSETLTAVNEESQHEQPELPHENMILESAQLAQTKMENMQKRLHEQTEKTDHLELQIAVLQSKMMSGAHPSTHPPTKRARLEEIPTDLLHFNPEGSGMPSPAPNAGRSAAGRPADSPPSQLMPRHTRDSKRPEGGCIPKLEHGAAPAAPQ